MTEQSENRVQEVEVNLLDYWRVLVKYKKLILIIVSSAFIISVIISFILPETYTSKSSILTTKTHMNRLIDILESQSLRDKIINRFDLKAVYNVKTRESARNTMDDNVKITKTLGNTIIITIEDKIPEIAAKLANAFVEELSNLNKKADLSKDNQKRISLENRLETSKAKLEDAENALSKQNTSGLKDTRLLREFKTQEAIYRYLSIQLEMARLSEILDKPTFQVLDRAFVPEKRSKPIRVRIVILALILSAFLSIFLAFFLEYLERIKTYENDDLLDHRKGNEGV